LHSLHETALEKVDAAYQAGVRRFDTVLGGYGGCPMTGKELVGNLSLESLITWSGNKSVETGLNMEMFQKAKAYPLFREDINFLR